MAYSYTTGFQHDFGAGPVDIGGRYLTRDYIIDEYSSLLPTNKTPGIWACGYGGIGNLGIGVSTNNSSPVQIGSLTNWKQIIGGIASGGVKTDGTLWMWGRVPAGLAPIVPVSSPVQIGTLSDWRQLAVTTSYDTAYAVKVDGTLWSWGNPTHGVLGQNSLSIKSSPTQVGALNNWKQVAVGSAPTMMAVKTDGTLWSCGYNLRGALGVGDLADRSSPTQVGTATDWSYATTNQYSSLMLKTNGTLWNCGYNLTNYNFNLSTPVQIGTLTNWKQITSGPAQCAAVKTDGTLWTWGRNTNSMLGQGVSQSVMLWNLSPTQVGTLTNWKSVIMNDVATVALKTDGTVWSWGGNFYGQLGQGNTTELSSPVQIGTLNTWKAVTCGYGSIFAIKDSNF